ncbi:hypothetical protein [Thauera sinica]|uniref:Uncharacterized protein n=1 Tax=Thauera sinica TaxID=2665146 RepID=A0ABW1ASL8_9RHOO|nr:hypothetical protein [Thauera sp. K11]ATE61476.1 hypothetical protein CCZ27_17310 [Thauera sp. K11]
MASKKHLMAFAMFFVLPGARCAPAAPNAEGTPWNQRTWEQRFVQSDYEDAFTFKHGETFYRDPFVWAVTKEFAERFGMPRQWIDPALKGALAVAWRITTIGRPLCGLGGDPEACSPAFTCQMDIYVDNDAPIPWRFDDVERDFLWPGLSSLDYVPRRPPAPRRSRYDFEDGRLGSKGVPFHKTGWEYRNGDTEIGFFISYFDRAYEPGITLLGFRSACPSRSSNGAAALRFFTEEEQSRTQGWIEKFVHTVEFSDAFMRRITDIYRRERERHQKEHSACGQMTQRLLPGPKRYTGVRLIDLLGRPGMRASPLPEREADAGRRVGVTAAP